MRSRGRKMVMLILKMLRKRKRVMFGMMMLRRRPELSVSPRNRNALKDLTRATSHRNLQEKMPHHKTGDHRVCECT